MLVLILGASGIGKSTVIDSLTENHGWLALTSYVTRPAREGETHKRAISDSEYEAMATRGEFWSDVSQSGYRYALLSSEVNQALCDPRQIYVVDYGLENRDVFFKDHSYCTVYLTVDSKIALEERLSAAGRSERLAAALATFDDLERWYSTFGRVEGALRIVNPVGAQLQVASEINRVARLRISNLP